jgi:hypothetical protein
MESHFRGSAFVLSPGFLFRLACSPLFLASQHRLSKALFLPPRSPR